jgi:hypothetical protein
MRRGEARPRRWRRANLSPFMGGPVLVQRDPERDWCDRIGLIRPLKKKRQPARRWGQRSEPDLARRCAGRIYSNTANDGPRETRQGLALPPFFAGGRRQAGCRVPAGEPTLAVMPTGAGKLLTSTTARHDEVAWSFTIDRALMHDQSGSAASATHLRHADQPTSGR